jgi:hypothetical protein
MSGSGGRAHSRAEEWTFNVGLGKPASQRVARRAGLHSYGVAVKLGVNLPQTTAYDLAHDVTVFAREAERIGFDSLWAYDRLLMPEDQSGAHGLFEIPDAPWPDRYGSSTDPLITLALVAAVTERVELGTGVVVPPLHLPVRLAKTLAALDAGSGGRLVDRRVQRSPGYQRPVEGTYPSSPSGAASSRNDTSAAVGGRSNTASATM